MRNSIALRRKDIFTSPKQGITYWCARLSISRLIGQHTRQYVGSICLCDFRRDSLDKTELH